MARMADLAAFALVVRLSIGLPFRFLWWMRLSLPMLARNRSFSAARQALSARTSKAVLFGSISPLRSRALPGAAAPVTSLRPMTPWRRSIEMWHL